MIHKLIKTHYSNNETFNQFFGLVLSANNHRKTDNDQQAGNVDLLPEVKTPKMYSVILLNDDYTPMDFVILVLRRFFGHSDEAAAKIMLDVHRKGAGVAGVYTLEVAEMKTMQVNQFSRINEHPFKCTMEEAP